MRPVYATRLGVAPRSDQSAVEAYEELIELAHRWMVAEVGPKLGNDPSWPMIIMNNATDDYRVANLQQTCRADVRNLTVSDERAWRGTIVHPFREAYHRRRDLQLRTEIQVRLAGRQSIVTIRRLIGATTDLVNQDTYEAQTPGLVHEIVAHLKPKCGNVEIRSGPWKVNNQRVRKLAAMVLDPDRLMPVVVISRTPDGSTLVDPDAMSYALAGLAQVAVLKSAGTAAYFAQTLNLALPVTDGSVRVFWPGFTPMDQPTKHQFFPADTLNTAEAGEDLRRHLRQMLGDLATWTFGSDRRVWEMEREAAEAEAAEREEAIAELLTVVEGAVVGTPTTGHLDQNLNWVLKDLREHLQSARAAARYDMDIAEKLLAQADRERQRADDRQQAAAREYQDLLGIQDEEIVALKRGVIDLQITNSQLNAQVQSAKRQVASAIAMCLDEISNVRSLADLLAVIEAGADLETIMFLPEARKAAADSPFQGNMFTVLQMLRRLCRVAAGYSAGAIGNFREAFLALGESRFAEHSSRETLKYYRDDYVRTYNPDGLGPREILLGPHLIYGTGGPNDHVRIYWHVDTANRRLVVGHVGKHLPIYSQR